MNQRTAIGGFLSITGAIIMSIFSYITISYWYGNELTFDTFLIADVDLAIYTIPAIILFLLTIAGIILTVIGIRLLLIELSKSKKEDFKGNNIEKK